MSRKVDTFSNCDDVEQFGGHGGHGGGGHGGHGGGGHWHGGGGRWRGRGGGWGGWGGYGYGYSQLYPYSYPYNYYNPYPFTYTIEQQVVVNNPGTCKCEVDGESVSITNKCIDPAVPVCSKDESCVCQIPSKSQ